MNHPLTDEICKSIAACYPYNKHIDIEDCGHIHDMRAAADWQLEECVRELEFLLSIFGTTGVIKEEAVPTLVALFKSNMRPQGES